MLRRLRRPASALIPILLVPALVACGGGSTKDDSSKDASASSSTGLSQVSFTGDVGKSISANWHNKISKPTSTSVKTLVKGDGPKVAKGDNVSTYLWIADGTTKKAAYSDYTKGASEPLPNNGQMGPVFDKVFTGATYGSRVVAVTSAQDLFGSPSAGTQLGIGADDSVVLVADLVKKAPVSPTPSDAKAHDVASNKLPKVVLKDGKPTGLDWTGIDKPSLKTPVQRTILKQGTGPVVKPTDSVTVNYLGETYKAKTPFDESYSKKPFTAPLTNLVKGWAIGLQGVKVGSRVLIQIPPAYGYGAQGSGSTIPGNATLWFVIDVVKASQGAAAPQQ